MSTEEIERAQKAILNVNFVDLDWYKNINEIKTLSKGSVGLHTTVFIYAVLLYCAYYSYKYRRLTLIILIGVFAILIPALIFTYGFEALETHLNKKWESVKTSVEEYNAAEAMWKPNSDKINTDAFVVEYVRNYSKIKSKTRDASGIIVGIGFALCIGIMVTFALGILFFDKLTSEDMDDFNLKTFFKVIGFFIAVLAVPLCVATFSGMRLASGQYKIAQDKHDQFKDKYTEFVFLMNANPSRFVEFFDDINEFTDILKTEHLN